MKKPEVKDEKEIKFGDYLIPEPEISQEELNDKKKKKKDKKIIDEDTKTKNVFPGKKDKIRHTPRRK